MKPILFSFLFMVTCLTSLAGEIDDKAVVRPLQPKQWNTFPLSAVRLLPGSPFYHAMQVSQQYLLGMDVDRMLNNRRRRAGLPEAGPYPGSNQPAGTRPGDLNHYLSGISLMYAQTGDARFLERVNYIIATFKACDDKIEARIKAGDTTVRRPSLRKGLQDLLRGRLELDGPDELGYPWGGMGNVFYTIHKEYAALRDAYLYANNTDALALWIKAAEPVTQFALQANPDLFDDMLDIEHGGMNEVFADLYALTGDKRYLEVSYKFNHQKVILNVANGKDVLFGRHANMQVPTFAGTARQYQLTGDDVSRRATYHFLQMVYRDHTSAIGGNSCYERFGKPGEITKRLGFTSNETCNTYNMLKVALDYFESSGDLQHMDYFEKALYNHILASQDPQTGGVTYYTALAPGCFKSYSKGYDLDGVWCCVGTGMENHSRYGEAIYFHNGKDLYVNLFIPSTLNWKEKGLQVTMQTRFPESDAVTLRIHENEGFHDQLYIRNPSWAKRGVQVRVNGQEVRVDSKAGEYIRLTANWKKGDEITIDVPQDFRLEAAPDDANMVAIYRGPLVLAGELGTNRMPGSDLVRVALDYKRWTIPTDDIPTLTGSRVNPAAWLQPVKDSALKYTTVRAGMLNNKPKEVTLVPYYKMHHQRYTIYWKLFSPDEQAYRKQVVSDEVNPAAAADEKRHNLRGEQTDTSTRRDHRNFWEENKPGRFARNGGWFSYDLKADKAASRQYVVVTYWGGVDVPSEFEVLANGKVIAAEKLWHNVPLSFFEQTYVLPAEAIANNNMVTIQFKAKAGNNAGGVYGVKITSDPVAFPGYSFY